MKNIESVKVEINEVVSLMEGQKKESGRIHGGTLKRYRTLKICKMYLEADPSEDFIRSERERVSSEIEIYFKRYKPLDPEKHSKRECRDYLKQFEKDFDIPTLRVQLSTLRYILN